MQEPRTYAEQVAMTPLKVTFGTKEFEIKPALLVDEIEWRTKFLTSLGFLDTFDPASIADKQPLDAVNLIKDSLIAGLVNLPDRVTEMLFEYAPYLPKDAILKGRDVAAGAATREQIFAAFSGVMQMVFPTNEQVKTLIEILRAEGINRTTQMFSR